MKMGLVISCCKSEVDDYLILTKMDLSHCGFLEVPPVVFTAEGCIDTLILEANQITSLPPQLFHCQEIRHLNLNDNWLSSIPPAIGSFENLVTLKLDKNNLQNLPDDLIMCKKMKVLSLNYNPWLLMPKIVTQLISLEELYMNDCDLNYLPASVGRLAKLRVIELRNNNLCNLPLSMTRLQMLNRLDIGGNDFSEFPQCVTELKGLVELIVDNNDLDEIADIRNLVHLEHLDASFNRIAKLSDGIGWCRQMTLLDLSFNYITQLPATLGNMTQLQTIHLDTNELTEIPHSLGKLSYLEELNVGNNKLHRLPNTIGLLRNLVNLNISRNKIDEIPPEIGSCTRLAIIKAAYNSIKIIPSELGYLKNLRVLDLVGNAIEHLPITILNLRQVRAIWLSANQNVPLIPFTQDFNQASGEHVLTNVALPQFEEKPADRSKEEKMVESNEKTASWNKKIRFAEEKNVTPSKLQRIPTPLPKELRHPVRRVRSEETRVSDDYVNVICEEVRKKEGFLLKPPPALQVTKTCSAVSCSDGGTTKARADIVWKPSQTDPFENFDLQNWVVDVDVEPKAVRNACRRVQSNFNEGIVQSFEQTNCL